MICNIEDKRAARRAKKEKRATECKGYIQGGESQRVETSHHQLAAAYPDRFADYL